MPKKPEKVSVDSSESTTPATTRSAPTSLDIAVTIVKASTLLFILSVVHQASQIAIHPHYGSYPTSLYFPTVIAGALSLAMVLPTQAWWEPFLLDVFSVTLCLTQNSVLHWVARTARWHSPIIGPIAAQLSLAIPAFVFGSLLLRINLFSILGVSHSNKFFKAVAFATTYAWVQMLNSMLEKPVFQQSWATSCNLFFGVGVAGILLNMLSFTVPAKDAWDFDQFHSYRRKGWPLKIANAICAGSILYVSMTGRPCNTATYPYNAGGIRVLAAAQSNTGMIVVGETEDFRFLRCDHSLLGGLWVNKTQTIAISTTVDNLSSPSGTDLRGERLGEPVYATFLLQDGVRLFDRGKKAHEDQSALILGLGIGVTARSMSLSGITPTVVEIDPVVHEYAQRFFNLSGPPAIPSSNPFRYELSPTTPQAHYEDARHYIQERAAAIRRLDKTARDAMRYDYVVHDVFSGGLLPDQMFTFEFFNDLKTVMKPDGIMALNFAGRINSTAARAVLGTLEYSFKHCKIFHDQLNPKKAKKTLGADVNQFGNLVFFCAQSEHIGLFLREHGPDDYLDSILRRYIFNKFSTLLLPRDTILRYGPAVVLTDHRNPLNQWQGPAALQHWKVMREVLPDAAWETY